jgi:hypothetical protein
MGEVYKAEDIMRGLPKTRAVQNPSECRFLGHGEKLLFTGGL